MILNVLGQSLVVERVHAEMLCESNSSILVVRLTEHERQESFAQIIRLLRGWPITVNVALLCSLVSKLQLHPILQSREQNDGSCAHQLPQ